MVAALNPSRYRRRRALTIVASAMAMLAGPAVGEVYYSDASFEISGTGARTSRQCVVTLKPTMTLGNELAPRIVITTIGQARLSFGIENAVHYSNAVTVQNNERKSFAGGDSIGTEQFRAADFAKILASRRLFFVTARRGPGGLYVSSRYDAVDFDAILTKVEASCPFDAESLMADVSQRERAERALSLSQSDLTLIRWALNKKYGGASSEPGARSALSQVERGYLKRYAADNILPVSQYLTPETARSLMAEGKRIVDLVKPVTPPPPPPGRPVFDRYVVGLDTYRADWLKLRRSPDPSDPGSSAIQIGLNTPVAVLEERGTFKLIKLRSGETGWVNSINVGCCRDEGSTATYHYAANLCLTCADGWLALRSLTNPRTEWRQDPKIWPGTIFTVLGQRGEFQFIQLKSGETGLVMSTKVACCR